MKMGKPQCYLMARRSFERNIDKILGKRRYLKIILQYYSCDDQGCIPFLSVCEGTKDCEELLGHISKTIKRADVSVLNYIRYPIFMALLWTEIKMGKTWNSLLCENDDGIRSNIATDNPYFSGPPYSETIANIRWIARQ